MHENTIFRMLESSVSRFPDRLAVSIGRDPDARSLTYARLREAARAVRRGLSALGCNKGDRVAILSENRPEWAVVDLAAQCMGVLTVPIYTSLPAPQVEHILRDSGARVLIASDARQLAKALEARSQCADLLHLVVMDGPAPEGAIDLHRLVELGVSEGLSDEALDAVGNSVLPDDDASVIYTSGTTGEPKGAVLTQRAALHTARVAPLITPLYETDVFLSFLPLCHVMERIGGHYLALSLGAHTVYSEGVSRVAQELRETRPTVFLCVPRLFERLRERVMEAASRVRGPRRVVWEWALRVGTEHARMASGAEGAPMGMRLQRMLADVLVMRRVRRQATGGRLRFVVSGGAPLDESTALFLEAIGLMVLEGYGLTECPVVSLNRPERRRPGTVGLPLEGIEVRCAPDGELLVRGPSLMRCYLGRPEATAEAIDADGWLHTGDIGSIEPNGVVRITDRKKDIIVLASGKNVAPQPIEAQLARNPYIAEIALVGDRQAGIGALVVPHIERLREWAQQHGVHAPDDHALVTAPSVRRLIREEIDRSSAGLADFERVKRFILSERPFSVEGGELTPTLKVKRRVIAERYRAGMEARAAARL
ncbi:MAG TPA: long-chain fatty acid--CoA ligase [Chthonomonadales bacterium]|nr:long-chain fatty acid--CoA ligase [Chthonomonadales bacterium]